MQEWVLPALAGRHLRGAALWGQMQAQEPSTQRRHQHQPQEDPDPWRGYPSLEHNKVRAQALTVTWKLKGNALLAPADRLLWTACCGPAMVSGCT